MLIKSSSFGALPDIFANNLLANTITLERIPVPTDLHLLTFSPVSSAPISSTDLLNPHSSSTAQIYAVPTAHLSSSLGS